MASSKKTKTANKSTAKAKVKQTPKTAASSLRRRKEERYKSFRLHKKIRAARPPLPSAMQLLRQTLKLLAANWKIFGGITLIYALLSLILVRGPASSVNLGEAKSALQDLIKGSGAGVTVAASLFGILAGTVGSVNSPTGGVYQSLFLIVFALATIWTLRRILAGESVRVRDAFYKGLYPLVPFILVLLVIGIQLTPLAIGNWLYAAVINNGIAASLAEKIIWILLFLSLATLSFYMVSSSLFALCVAALPDMTPVRALRSARNLVLHRRWTVIKKLLFLIVAMPILIGIVMVPFIVFITTIAESVFFLLTTFATVVAFTYIYLLYRELLNE